MKNHFPKTIRKSITYMTVIFTLIITISSASFSYYMFNTMLSNSLVQSTSFNLHLISGTITSDLTPIITFSKWCSNNSQLSRFLESAADLKELQTLYLYKSYQLKDSRKVEELQELDRTLDKAKSNNRALALNAWNRMQEEYRNNRSSIYMNRIIISNGSERYLQLAPFSSYHAFSITDTVTQLPYFSELYDSSSEVWTGIELNPFSDNKNELMLPMIRPVYSVYGNKKIGWCYISISTDVITNALKNYNIPESSNLILTIGQKSYQYQNGTFTEYEPEYTVINQESSADNIILTKVKDNNGRHHKVVTVKSSLNGWYFSQTLSSSIFAKQQSLYILLICLLSLTVLSLGLGLTFYLNRQINKPLGKIYRKIRLIAQGDFSRDPEIEWKNELGEIGHGINALAKDVVQLMEKRIEDEKEKNDLEYQMLQSQINPHFLYNTLNTIKWMATIQNAGGIAEMTTSLARLMKVVSKDPKQIHTIRDEISLLNDYFVIQSYRYGGTISLDYDIPTEDLYHCKILKFSLQPMVENAIFHGIEPKSAMGNITISIRKFDSEQIIIEIKDDGIGMTEEQIQKSLSGEAKTEADLFNKIGIDNVNRRIKYTFGQQYGLSIKSELGKYTVMTILLPYLQQERNEVND